MTPEREAARKIREAIKLLHQAKFLDWAPMRRRLGRDAAHLEGYAKERQRKEGP